MSEESTEGTGKILRGDGSWAFQAVIDGEDIVFEDIVITCFGGWGDGNIADPCISRLKELPF